MGRLAILYSGVNTRADAALSARVLRLTSALTFVDPFDVTKLADDDGYYWLHIRYDDALEAYVRADKARIIGDYRLLGMQAYETLDWAQGRLAGAFGQPPATAPSSPATTSGGRWASPVSPYKITQAYGANGHLGVDLGSPDPNNSIGTPVYARGKGKVWQSNPCGGCPGGNGAKAGTTDEATNYGFGVEVITEHSYADLPATAQKAMDDLHLTGGFLYVIHGHLDSLSVGTGASVVDGTLIGKRGTSGNSTGPHLHVEVRVRLKASDRGLWSGDPAQVIDPAALFAL